MSLIKRILTNIEELLFPTGDIGNSGFYKKNGKEPYDVSQEELEAMRRKYDRVAVRY